MSRRDRLRRTSWRRGKRYPYAVWLEILECWCRRLDVDRKL